MREKDTKITDDGELTKKDKQPFLGSINFLGTPAIWSFISPLTVLAVAFFVSSTAVESNTEETTDEEKNITNLKVTRNKGDSGGKEFRLLEGCTILGKKVCLFYDTDPDDDCASSAVTRTADNGVFTTGKLIRVLFPIKTTGPGCGFYGYMDFLEEGDKLKGPVKRFGLTPSYSATDFEGAVKEFEDDSLLLVFDITEMEEFGVSFRKSVPQKSYQKGEISWGPISFGSVHTFEGGYPVVLTEKAFAGFQKDDNLIINTYMELTGKVPSICLSKDSITDGSFVYINSHFLIYENCGGLSGTTNDVTGVSDDGTAFAISPCFKDKDFACFPGETNHQEEGEGAGFGTTVLKERGNKAERMITGKRTSKSLAVLRSNLSPNELVTCLKFEPNDNIYREGYIVNRMTLFEGAISSAVNTDLDSTVYFDTNLTSDYLRKFSNKGFAGKTGNKNGEKPGNKGEAEKDNENNIIETTIKSTNGGNANPELGNLTRLVVAYVYTEKDAKEYDKGNQNKTGNNKDKYKVPIINFQVLDTEEKGRFAVTLDRQLKKGDVVTIEFKNTGIDLKDLTDKTGNNKILDPFDISGTVAEATGAAFKDERSLSAKIMSESAGGVSNARLVAEWKDYRIPWGMFNHKSRIRWKLFADVSNGDASPTDELKGTGEFMLKAVTTRNKGASFAFDTLAGFSGGVNYYPEADDDLLTLSGAANADIAFYWGDLEAQDNLLRIKTEPKLGYSYYKGKLSISSETAEAITKNRAVKFRPGANKWLHFICPAEIGYKYGGFGVYAGVSVSILSSKEMKVLDLKKNYPLFYTFSASFDPKIIPLSGSGFDNQSWTSIMIIYETGRKAPAYVQTDNRISFAFEIAPILE